MTHLTCSIALFVRRVNLGVRVRRIQLENRVPPKKNSLVLLCSAPSEKSGKGKHRFEKMGRGDRQVEQHQAAGRPHQGLKVFVFGQRQQVREKKLFRKKQGGKVSQKHKNVSITKQTLLCTPKLAL